MTGTGHGHSADPRGLRSRLGVAFGITATIVVVQAVGAILTGSLALLTDTAHALADASGLLVALIAATLVLRPANSRRTWGFRRIEVIAALGQAALLIVVGVYAAIEGVRRLFEPPELVGGQLLVFGIVGLAANIVAIVVLSSSRGANFNMRAAFLEVLNDAIGSVGVIIAAIVITTTGFQQADAIAGLLIAALIVPRAVTLLRDTVSVLMEFTPRDVELDAIRSHLQALDRVQEVHDLHASTIATGLPVLTAHLVVDDECLSDGSAPEVLTAARRCLTEHFPVAIHHSTFQLESAALAATESTEVRHQ